MSMEETVKDEFENIKWRNNLKSEKEISAPYYWLDIKFGSFNFVLGGYKWYCFSLESNPHYLHLEGTKWYEKLILRTPWRRKESTDV